MITQENMTMLMNKGQWKDLETLSLSLSLSL
jgi:hypothetical protein